MNDSSIQALSAFCINALSVRVSSCWNSVWMFVKLVCSSVWHIFPRVVQGYVGCFKIWGNGLREMQCPKPVPPCPLVHPLCVKSTVHFRELCRERRDLRRHYSIIIQKLKNFADVAIIRMIGKSEVQTSVPCSVCLVHLRRQGSVFQELGDAECWWSTSRDMARGFSDESRIENIRILGRHKKIFFETSCQAVKHHYLLVPPIWKVRFKHSAVQIGKA